MSARAAANAYRDVGVDSGVNAADPHRLILMLFDGALAAIHQATGHMHAARTPEKCVAIGRALRIVDEGLKASLDPAAGGELASRLMSLYDYAVMRLLQANLRNDVSALSEVSSLLSELRGAWALIGAKSEAPVAYPDAPVAAVSTPVRPKVGFFDAQVASSARMVATAA